MIINFCTKILDRMSVAPDRISLGPRFNADTLRFSQAMDSSGPVLFATINGTKVYVDPAVQGRRIKVRKDKKEKTFNYRAFAGNEGSVAF